MNRLNIILSCTGLLAATGLLSVQAQSPAETVPARPYWIEADSAKAIASRTRADFPFTFGEAAAIIRKEHPEVSDSDIRQFISHHYIEAKVIDDTLRIHRKSPRNLNLLNPAMNGGARFRGDRASEKRISYADSILRWQQGLNPEGGAHEVTFVFSIDVPYNEALVGDTLRVWMPFPLESQRQHSVEVISAFPQKYLIADTLQSVHHSIYFEQPASSDPGHDTHFEYTARFTTKGEYHSPETIAKNTRPYETASELYRRYTSFESPHIIRLDSLAKAITGGETDPWRCSELVYDHIIRTYPWAGAREYSTIECIPEYVIGEGHGDCGQVALLYISLMRTLGIPARWESGWMLHPGEKNLHDWAEVYFEGIGWVPVDISFGRYTTSGDPRIVNFYSTGMDSHRFAANRGVCGELYPPKKYVRSETVDFQLGEVECNAGNIFYPGWRQSLRLLEVKPVSEQP